MAVGADSPVVTDYLQRLEAAAATLPDGRRAELVAEIRAHVAEALAAAGRDDEPTVRAVLDRLGEPADIVAAEADGADRSEPRPPLLPAGPPSAYPAAPRSPWGAVEILAIVGLTAGTVLIPVVGLLLGLVFLWASQQWTRREKWIGTAWSLAPVLAAAFAALFLFTARTDSTVETPQIVQAPAVVESSAVDQPFVTVAPTPAP